jgi:hypothetical protein
MATNKRLTELIDDTSVLPYASEMFGIYQPLLGWKSKRIVQRFEQRFQNDKLGLIDKLKTDFTGQVNVHYLPDCQIRVQIRPGALDAGRLKTFDSVVLQKIAEQLPPYEQIKPERWLCGRAGTPSYAA